MAAKQKYLHPGDTLRKYGIIPEENSASTRQRLAKTTNKSNVEKRVFDVGEYENLGDAARRITTPAPSPKRPATPHAAGRLTPKQIAEQPARGANPSKPMIRRLNRVGSTAKPSFGVTLPKGLISPWTGHGLRDTPSSVKCEAVELPGGGVGILITPADQGALIDSAGQSRGSGEWDAREFEYADVAIRSPPPSPCGRLETDPDILGKLRRTDLCNHRCAIPCPDCGCGV